MNKAKENNLTAERFDISCSFEAVCDHTMPEYYPEIRRVVSVTATPLPDSKFLSGNTLEFGGCVAFSMLYIGEDGSLSVLPCTCEYSERAALPEEIRGTAEAVVDVSLSDASFRVTAPRRVTLRAKLRARITSDKAVSCIESAMEGEKPCDMATCRTIKTLRRTVPTAVRGSASQTGSASGEWKAPSGTKVISCPGTVHITEVKAKNGAGVVRGDVVLKCLVFTDKGVYSSQKIKLPFEEVVSDEEIREGDEVAAYGRVASSSVGEEPEGSGEFKAEAEIDLCLKWMRGSECSILCDAYSTAFEMTPERKDTAAVSPLCCVSSSLSVNGSGTRSSRPREGEYLVDVDLTPRFEKAEISDGKAVFSGNILAKAYIAGEGDVTAEEFTLPLRFECRCDDGEGDVVWWADAVAVDSVGRLEGDTVAVSGEICLAISAHRRNKLSPVTVMQIQRGEPRGEREAELRVIYPDGGERLWDIAKHCGADIDAVERVNGISRDDEAKAPVVIPM